MFVLEHLGLKVVDEFEACFKTIESRSLMSREHKIEIGKRFHLALRNLQTIFDVDHTQQLFGFSWGDTGLPQPPRRTEAPEAVEATTEAGPATQDLPASSVKIEDLQAPADAETVVRVPSVYVYSMFHVCS